MKKIGLIFKETSENRIKEALKDSNSVLVVRYSGVKSPDMSALRLSLRGSGASLFVVKNSVARRALKTPQLEVLIKSIDGPCGLVFTKDEPVGASRVLCAFSKDHEALKLEGGVMEERVLMRQDIEAIAKLPVKEVLRAQVVRQLNSPISGLAIVLNQILAKFVYCIDQIRQKKTEGGK